MYSTDVQIDIATLRINISVIFMQVLHIASVRKLMVTEDCFRYVNQLQ